MLASPALPFLTTRVIGDGGDAYQFLSWQFLAKRLAVAGEFPFGWTDYWRYPHGIDFQSTFDSSLLILLGLLLYALGAGPVVVYNVSVLIVLFLNLVVSYLAFRTWFSRDLALVGAVAFGASFYTLARLGGHPNLMGTAGFALFFAAAFRVHRDGRARDVGLLAAASLYLAYSSLQYPLILVGTLLLLAPLSLIFLPGVPRRLVAVLWSRRLAATASLCALVAGVALLHGGKLADLERGRVIMPPAHLMIVPPVNFVVPNPYLPTAAAVVQNGTEWWIDAAGAFLGYVEIVLFAVAVARVPSTALKRWLLAAIAVLFVVALGQRPLLSSLWPYPYLFQVLPFRGIIEPVRFAVPMYLGMTVLLLLYLGRMRRRGWVFLVAALLVAERLPTGLRLSPTYDDPALVAAVNRHDSRAVLDLPMYLTWWRGQLYDIYSVHSGRPIVAGYVHWSGDRRRSRALVDELREFGCYLNPDDAVRDFDPAEAARKREWLLATMERHGIRVVVVHKDLIDTPARCGAASRHMDFLLEDSRRWDVVLDSPSKRVLWLRPTPAG